MPNKPKRDIRLHGWPFVLMTAVALFFSVPFAEAQQYQPVQSEVDSAKAQQVQEEQRSAYQSAIKDGPKLDKNCKTGKMVGQCMFDYCGNDATDSVTACISAQGEEEFSKNNKAKCWSGYGCEGSKKFCCVIPKDTAGECFWDYEGADRGGVSFVCAADADQCKTKYPGGTSMGGGFGCSSGICCKVGKSVAQKAQNSECYLDYNGADSGGVHFVCSADDQTCKNAGGTSMGKGFGCNAENNPVCCKKQGIAPTGSSVSGRTARKNVPINSFCFTAKECADAGGTWRAGEGCTNKGNIPQGKCTAPEPDYELQNPIIGTTTIKGLRSYIGLIFTAGISFALIAAAIMFVYGAFKYMVSAVGAQVSRAKETMIDALIGMVLALSSYVILANVAPNTLNMNAFRIDMINRMSFYSVVYCSDLKPGPKEQELMFQDAGTIDRPESFDLSKGYTVKSTDTQCGREYFISGSDSQTVCNGKSCNKGAKCLNCASGISSNCKTGSSAEYKCTDAVIGGNVASVGSLKPKFVSVDMLVSDAAEQKFDNIEFDSFSFYDGQIKSVGDGYLTSYSLSASKVSTDKVIKVWNEQEKAGKRVIGIYIIAAFKPSGKIGNIFGVDLYNIYVPVSGKGLYVGKYLGGPKNCAVGTAVSEFVTVADTSCTFAGYVEHLHKNYPLLYEQMKTLGMKKQDFQVQDALGTDVLLCDIKVGEDGKAID